MRAALLVLLAGVCFGTTGTAQALGPDVDPVVLGAARIAVGGLGLAVVSAVLAVAARARTTAPVEPVTPRAPGAGRRAVVPLVLGVAGVIAYQPAFFLGTARNGVAVGTVVALGSAPVVTGLLAWLVRRERPGAWWVAATVPATAGVVVLGLGGGGVDGVDALGVLASVGAGAAYAVYTVAAAQLIAGGWSATTSMAAVFGGAGLVGAAVLVGSGAPGLGSAAGWATVLWLGLVTTTLAYLLFGYGLARLGPPTVATLTLAEPVTATLLGLVVLGEVLAGWTVVGLVVLAAGLLVLVVGARRRRPAAVAA